VTGVPTISPPALRRALLRPPSPRLAEGIVTHIDRVPIDLDRATAQWHGYLDALRAAGWECSVVPPAEDCPDSVFVEDPMVMLDGTAVLTRPGAPSRRGETAGVARFLRERGYPMREMSGPGTLDGGDVLKVGRTVYVGRGGRTDAAGLAEFRRLAEPCGYTVIGVPVTKVLHLKSSVTALPDSTIIGYPPLVDDPSFFPHFRPMPEESGSHVVDLGDSRLLIAASAPRSAELLAQLGYTPVPVDISEFESLEGCVTCLSVRLRREPGSG